MKPKRIRLTNPIRVALINHAGSLLKDRVLRAAEKAAHGAIVPSFRKDLAKIKKDLVVLDRYNRTKKYFTFRFDGDSFRVRSGEKVFDVDGKQVTRPEFDEIKPPVGDFVGVEHFEVARCFSAGQPANERSYTRRHGFYRFFDINRELVIAGGLVLPYGGNDRVVIQGDKNGGFTFDNGYHKGKDDFNFVSDATKAAITKYIVASNERAATEHTLLKTITGILSSAEYFEQVELLWPEASKIKPQFDTKNVYQLPAIAVDQTMKAALCSNLRQRGVAEGSTACAAE